jgi:hypothetical protein
VPGKSLPRPFIIRRPRLNLAMPDVRFEQGSMTLNSGRGNFGESCEPRSAGLTFGLWRDFAFRFYRDGGRLEDFLVQGRELVEVVAILLLSRAPREVHIADFGRNHRQITVERWIAQQMRNATVLDGENPQRVPAEHLHLLLADPNREIAGRLVCLVLVILLIVMGQIMMFMSSDGDLSEEENVKDREDDERSHYECLESVKRKTVTQSGARPRKRRKKFFFVYPSRNIHAKLN